MNTREKVLSIAVASAFGLALAPAYATEPKTERKATTTQKQNQSQSQSYWGIRASELIGKEVHNAQGENLGEIEDIVIDAKNGHAHYAVLQFGGVGNLGDKLFAYPLSAFQKSGDDKDELVLNVDDEQLKQAQGFDDENWPNWSDPKYQQHVTGNFGDAKPVAKDARLVRASEFLDEEIENAEGDDIGELEDIVVNLNDSKVHFAVADLDDWGFDDKLFALPIQAFRMNEDGDELVLNLSKNQIDENRGFDESKWPDMNDPAFVSEMDGYLVTLVPGDDPGDAGKLSTSSPKVGDEPGAAGRAGTPRSDDKMIEGEKKRY